MILWLLACVAEDRLPARLDDPTAWAVVPGDEDPLADHRPDDVFCPVSTWGEEDGTFEVQTGACRYGGFAQPLGVLLRRGDRLTGTVWHEDLDASEPAEAHVAVLVGDAVVWETFVAIPTPADIHPFDVTLPRGVDDAASIGFHVHNHGFNSWRLTAMEWTPR